MPATNGVTRSGANATARRSSTGQVMVLRWLRPRGWHEGEPGADSQSSCL